MIYPDYDLDCIKSDVCDKGACRGKDCEHRAEKLTESTLTAIREALMTDKDIKRIVCDDAENIDWNDWGSKRLYLETRITEWRKQRDRTQKILDGEK